jgi:4-oxalocrotonate tautomerase
MPIVEITLLEGRDDDAKTRLCAQVTEAIVSAIGAPPDSVRVILREVPPLHYAVGGVTKQAAKSSA